MSPGAALAVDLAEAVMQQHVGRTRRRGGCVVADDARRRRSAPLTTSLSNQQPRKSAALLVKRSSSSALVVEVEPQARAARCARRPTAPGCRHRHWAACAARARAERRPPAPAPPRRPAAARHRAAKNGAIARWRSARPPRMSRKRALIDRPEVCSRPLDDLETVAGELEIGDDSRIEQAHGVGGDRVAEARDGIPRLPPRRRRRRSFRARRRVEARGRQIGRAGEAVVAGADDDDVIVCVGHSPLVERNAGLAQSGRGPTRTTLYADGQGC